MTFRHDSQVSMMIHTYFHKFAIIFMDIAIIFQAKQRASIKWLVSKAYNHRTPEESLEPFYKDHDVRI